MSITNGIFIAACFILFAFRLWLGRMVGIWFPANQYYDDGLMMRYADLYNHFVAQTEPFNELLLKDMGFSLFLNFVNITGLQYTDWLAILWFFAAVLFVYLFFRLTRISNPAILLAVYVFVLFTPAAFDSWCGTRLYRAGLLTPLYCICLTMMSILAVRHFDDTKIHRRGFLLFQTALGLILTLTYYVKEDGLWLLMCLVTVLILCVVKVFVSDYQIARVQLTHIALLLIPIIIFEFGTVTYKLVNYKFFGVYEINTRTEGELGKFFKLIYKIESADRTSTVWAATDAIGTAFEVSETLRNNDKLRDSVMHSNWFGGDIKEHPIHGDFLGWVTLSAIRDSGVCNSVLEQEEFFRQVNQELEDAFDDGRLRKDGRFQLVSSMGGRNLKELFDLRKLTASVYRIHLTTFKYGPGALEYALSTPANTDEEMLIQRAIKLTNTDLTRRREHFMEVNVFLTILFIFYAILQTAMFFMALAGIYWAIVAIYRRKMKFGSQNFLVLSVTISNLLLSLVYAIAIAWFCEFISDHELRYAALKFYSVGVIPMLTATEIFGSYLFYLYHKSQRRKLL